MSYVDGFVIVVPKAKMKVYTKMAKEGKETWMKFGAVSYMECVGDDLKSLYGGLEYPDMIKAKKTDNIIFSFIVFKNKKHRDSVNKKVHAFFAKKYTDPKDQEMPFDMKHMAYGGFKAFVEA